MRRRRVCAHDRRRCSSVEGCRRGPFGAALEYGTLAGIGGAGESYSTGPRNINFNSGPTLRAWYRPAAIAPSTIEWLAANPAIICHQTYAAATRRRASDDTKKGVSLRQHATRQQSSRLAAASPPAVHAPLQLIVHRRYAALQKEGRCCPTLLK